MIILSQDAAYGTQIQSQSTRIAIKVMTKVTAVGSGSLVDDCSTSDSIDTPSSYVSLRG